RASSKRKINKTSSDWEERVLGLRRPNQARHDLFWRAQFLKHRNSQLAAEQKDPLLWLLDADVFDRISPAAANYLIDRYSLISKDNKEPLPESLSPATDELTNQIVSPGDNIKINDPRQDTGTRVQSQTASASFGNTIVVVYNHSSNFQTRTASSTDGGSTWSE